MSDKIDPKHSVLLQRLKSRIEKSGHSYAWTEDEKMLSEAADRIDALESLVMQARMILDEQSRVSLFSTNIAAMKQAWYAQYKTLGPL